MDGNNSIPRALRGYVAPAQGQDRLFVSGASAEVLRRKRLAGILKEVFARGNFNHLIFSFTCGLGRRMNVNFNGSKENNLY